MFKLVAYQNQQNNTVKIVFLLNSYIPQNFLQNENWTQHTALKQKQNNTQKLITSSKHSLKTKQNNIQSMRINHKKLISETTKTAEQHSEFEHWSQNIDLWNKTKTEEQHSEFEHW